MRTVGVHLTRHDLPQQPGVNTSNFRASFRVDGQLCTNKLVFATPEEALAHSEWNLSNWTTLSQRWFHTQLVFSDADFQETPSPVNHRFNLGVQHA